MQNNLQTVDTIYDSYLNGQRKQMVSQIRQFESDTGESFWETLDKYIQDWTPVMKYRTLFEMLTIYTNLNTVSTIQDNGK